MRRCRSATRSRKRRNNNAPAGSCFTRVEAGTTVQLVFVRATAIVCRPQATWRRIATESTSISALALGYVVPLAALGPLATYVALRNVGARIGNGVTYHASVAEALREALSSFGFALGGVALIALLIVALAPRFGIARSFERSFRVAAHALTPVWIAGLTLLVPQLTLGLPIAAGYAIVLLALGIEIVLHVRRRRAIVFAAVVIVCALGSGFVFGAGVAIVRGLTGASP